MLLFQSLPLLRCQVANPRARNRSDLVRPSPSSMHRRDSPSASCLPKSASGRPSRHCICKRHTTSLLIRPCCFGNIQPQYFHDVSASSGFAQFLGENWCTCFVRHLTKSRDDARGDGTRFSVADRSPICFYDWDNLCGSARKKAFVSNKNIMTRDVSFPNFDVKFGGDFKHYRARNSSQRAGRDGRREDLAVFNNEYIISSAFGNVPCVIQHERFIRPRQICLNPRHHVV